MKLGTNINSATRAATSAARAGESSVRAVDQESADRKGSFDFKGREIDKVPTSRIPFSADQKYMATLNGHSRYMSRNGQL